ncbi:MAG: hypothetical protein IJP68_03875 [Selenomonadaceae bacterium]|nr:hypothetical protein [Selenomonadaceae bacterium]
MNEKDLKRILKPIYIVIEKLVPTNRSLLDFTNEKAVGSGMKRSVYKVKFLDKAEKSSYQVTSVTLVEFEKHLKGLQLGKADEEQLLKEANKLLDNAKNQLEKVYGEVRRYIVTKELRNDCLKENYRKIPSMNDAQNAAISQEIFSMAIDAVNKSEDHNIEDVEAEFNKINYIATALFNIAAANSAPIEIEKAPAPAKAPVTKKPQKKSFLDRFF